MDFIEWDLLLLFSLPLVSSPFRGESQRVCVFSWAEADTSTHAALSRRVTLLVEAISERIDALSSCAAEILLNTDSKPQVTSPNPAH